MRSIAAIQEDLSRDRQRLPLENAAVYYQNSKITEECGTELRYQIGRMKACFFYLEELGCYAATFDAVNWETHDRATANKPEMFRLWLCKQCSGFSATGKNMGRWYGSDSTCCCCPNCYHEDKDSQHLMYCYNPGRFGLFQEGVKELFAWMAKGHTHPDLEMWLPCYLNHGRRQFSSMPGLLASLQRLAHY